MRDIFAMGARPIALLNSLRFGPPVRDAEPVPVRGRRGGHLVLRQLASAYRTSAARFFFSYSYSGNPLVNAMCVGLVEKDRLMRATTGPPGSVMMLAGSETGRDGIHGASGLASRTFEDEREMRPAVQVSNPFLEKVLIEACLEAAASGHVVGMQDLGAAGLTSASVEAAGNGGCGFDLEGLRRAAQGEWHDPVRGDALRVPGADAPVREGGQRRRGSGASSSGGTSTRR